MGGGKFHDTHCHVFEKLIFFVLYTFHEDSKVDVNESKNEKIIYKSCVFLSYLSRIKVSLSPLGMS